MPSLKGAMSGQLLQSDYFPWGRRDDRIYFTWNNQYVCNRKIKEESNSL